MLPPAMGAAQQLLDAAEGYSEDDEEEEEEEEFQEEENEELLLALEESLSSSACGPAPLKRACLGLADRDSPKANTAHLMHWPVEVRLCIASFLPWKELMGDTLLCKSWKALDLQDALWKVFFISTWPRLARRREAGADGAVPWRALFRARWARADRKEDSLEEDWLDFSAAQGLEACRGPRDETRRAAPVLAIQEASAKRAAAAELERAVRRCREELMRSQGLQVPVEADAQHQCRHVEPGCRFHRLGIDAHGSGLDCFLCEVSGTLHMCKSVPCGCCVRSADGCFLVCPVSGRCFPKDNSVNEEADESGRLLGAEVTSHNWDPELSAAQQIGRWFEQGYSMSEDQAHDFFGGKMDGGGGSGRRHRRRACIA
ncbi:unnamed protein product [Polarella glacialis]|uniref:F-box domain-containing protein n=1 Tax=Polarella glacialis TaxID=89957 RepID=A0A813EYD0_POLGL|nr:unnamed protein product [Polarella glacialis]